MRRFTGLSGLLALVLVLFGCASMSGAGWTTLIDGTSGLENFDRVGDANWRAEDGAIVADKGKGNSFLVTKRSYRDFQLRAEFHAESNTNSGIFIRMQDRKDIGSKNSYEVNIFDTRPGPEYGTGAIVNFVKVDPMPKAGGRWNVMEITARGADIVVVLNGVESAHLRDAKWLEGPFSLQFGNIPPKELPGAPIKFRKVQIREL